MASPTTPSTGSVRPDGRIVWVSDQAVVLRDDQGNPRFSQGVIFDITARKEARGAAPRGRGTLPGDRRTRSGGDLPRRRGRVDAVRSTSARRSRRSPGISPDEWIADPDAWLETLASRGPRRVLARVPRGRRRRASRGAPSTGCRRATAARSGSTTRRRSCTTTTARPTFMQGVICGHHRAQARRAGTARDRAARARGRRATPGARRDEEHLPRGGLPRAAEPAHVDPRAVAHAGADAGAGARRTATTCCRGSRRTPASSTAC